jgi:hypothetical protein
MVAAPQAVPPVELAEVTEAAGEAVGQLFADQADRQAR